MKKLFLTILAGLLVSAQVSAVSVSDVCGRYNGNLTVDGVDFADKMIYLLPGTVNNSVTFVLPDFTYNAGKLGNIVLPNIPMDDKGQLSLEKGTLYIGASLEQRATIDIINGLKEGGKVYNSVVSAAEAQVLLQIAAPSLKEPIFVFYNGKSENGANYLLPNGGFEGEWKDSEPAGWHSFNSATGLMVDFVKKPDQFVQATDVRPGSEGSASALISSKMVAGAKANGNCTNGRINAGSMTAEDAAGNYNFSDPAESGFNTPFNGRPDSIVFWAKYQPADRNAENEVNKARVSVIITTDARYQDPEGENDYAEIKIGSAIKNYSATANMDWQRISVPFEYEAANAEKQPAYILATFTTNMTPGGGSSYSEGKLTKVNVLDSVYLDDVELVYNREMLSLSATDKNGKSDIKFEKNIAKIDAEYCDSCYVMDAKGNGQTSQVFIGYDAAHKCAYAYIIADDYAQTKQYSLYRMDFTDSQTDDLEPIKEGLAEIPAAALQYEKVMIDGHLLIRKGDAWYNAAGVRIQ